MGEGLKELIERVEAATGPDRELDVALCLALSYIAYAASPLNLRPSEDDDAEWLDYELVENGKMVDCSDEAPELSASVDAALALAERRLGDHWYGVLLDAVREFGTAGTFGPDRLARYIVLATLRALDRSGS